MLGELTGEDESDGSLHLSGRHGLSPVVLDKASSFTGDSVESVSDKGVEDRHRSLGHSSVRVDLLENAVDVDVVGLSSAFSHGEVFSWS